jgi:hypothetical protein
VLLLNVRLSKKNKQPALHRTFDELWSLIQAPSGYGKWRWDELKATNKLLRRVSGYGHEVDEVEWVIFDPVAYQGKSPQEALELSNADGMQLAGTEVLMATLLFPDWPLSWFKDNMPAPNLSGLQFYWNAGWSHVPCLRRWDGRRQLELSANWAGRANSCGASPSVREC